MCCFQNNSPIYSFFSYNLFLCRGRSICVSLSLCANGENRNKKYFHRLLFRLFFGRHYELYQYIYEGDTYGEIIYFTSIQVKDQFEDVQSFHWYHRNSISNFESQRKNQSMILGKWEKKHQLSAKTTRTQAHRTQKYLISKEVG